MAKKIIISNNHYYHKINHSIAFMVFGLFKTRCPVCKMEVNKETAINRFDKYFCSEGHAEEYRKERARQQSASHHGGCCH
ncbi:MAG: hypothetical protein Q8N81_06845 [bacterium]|nr:hypothetical protein [bacterium]